MSIASEIERLQGAKRDIKDAIEGKGVTVPSNAKLNDYSTYIENIPSGGGGSDLDWSAIGYNSTPSTIVNGYNYAVEIKNNWNSSTTSLSSTFMDDYNLVIMPLIDTSNVTSMISTFYGSYTLMTVPLLNTGNVTGMNECFRECRSLVEVPKFNTQNVKNMQRMFSNCYALTTVPLFDTSSLTGNSAFTSMFGNCNNLTDTSLDNILQMCINATSYTGTKALTTLGLNRGIYSSRISGLTHYQDFIDAGWTTGF